MKSPPAIIADSVTVIVLYGFLALYMVGFFAPPPFAADHGLTVWAVFAAAICFLYAFIQAGQRSILRFFTLFARLLLCLGLALFLDSMIYVWWYRPGDHEWSLGTVFLSLTALIFGCSAFISGYVARILRDRLTPRSR